MLSRVEAQDVSTNLAFREVTLAAGLTAVRDPLGHFLVDMAGGGTVGDFNRDGWQDIFFLAGGNQADALYVSNGDGTFTERAAQAGVAARHRGIGAAVGDYDGDGWLDIFITSLGTATGPAQPGQHRLYHNNGDGTFTNRAAAAGVSFSSRTRADGMGAAFGDYDLDGDLDLFVSSYSVADGNRLFRNNGDGAFTDVTDDAAPIGLSIWGFAPAFVDMDGDRYPELLIAADHGTSRYLLNNGDGSFVDATDASGTGWGANGMGSAIADFNDDGLPDWYLTSVYSNTGMEGEENGNQLYINQGSNRFRELSREAGVNNGGWGWGAVAVDLNHDLLLDIVTTNGWTKPNFYGEFEWLTESTRIFLSRGDLSFQRAAQQVGLVHRKQGRGLVNFDYDNDGDQDILIFNHAGRMSLFRNDLPRTAGNWFRLFLDTSGHSLLAPNGFGTRVSVLVNEKRQYRYIHGGSTYLGVAELSAHFGLGSAEMVDELRIEWADGRVTHIRGLPANQTITVRPDD